ncbi:MAG: hypothetical protein IJ599_05200 [Alphaproteobacteria bacterium]|nr:hypothetical protein [Alphaproteobacteria bacterium]
MIDGVRFAGYVDTIDGSVSPAHMCASLGAIASLSIEDRTIYEKEK